MYSSSKKLRIKELNIFISFHVFSQLKATWVIPNKHNRWMSGDILKSPSNFNHGNPCI